MPASDPTWVIPEAGRQLVSRLRGGPDTAAPASPSCLPLEPAPLGLQPQGPRGR